ncbi:hypothetical protein ACFLXL_02375, partial [Chloroflexota bacterium]
MQPSPNIVFCPACHTPKRPNEVTCSQCGARSCPNGHIIDSRICRQCSFEDRSWKPQAKTPSLGATVQKSQGIPEVTETVCPRCTIKTIFTYGRCHNCGFILESKQYGETKQEATRPSHTPDVQLSQDPSQFVVKQQLQGTYDAKLTYICSKCGSKADPRTGQCQTCGYIGPLTYEMPKQQAPGGPPSPPAQAKAPVKPQSFPDQHLQHPQETTRPCTSCGASVPYDSRFCRQCGTYSGPSRHIGAQSYSMGAAEKVRGGIQSPGISNQPAPSMQPIVMGGGMAQDVMGGYM